MFSKEVLHLLQRFTVSDSFLRADAYVVDYGYVDQGVLQDSFTWIDTLILTQLFCCSKKGGSKLFLYRFSLTAHATCLLLVWFQSMACKHHKHIMCYLCRKYIRNSDMTIQMVACVWICLDQCCMILTNPRGRLVEFQYAIWINMIPSLHSLKACCMEMHDNSH